MSHLFRLDGLDTPGFDAEDVTTLINCVPEPRRKLIMRSVSRIHAALTSTGIVYLSGSHWSPAVGNRQSVIACNKTMATGRSETRMAIAFFAITLDSGRGNLSSLVQYLGEIARKPTPTLTQLHDDECAITAPIEVAINVSKTNDSLRYCLVKLIQGHANDYCEDADADNDLLRSYLLYGEPREPQPGWLKDVLKDYTRTCEQALSGPTNTTALRQLTRELRNAFADRNLSERQVGFICAMQEVWQQAFGGRFLYAFPAVFGKRRCVLTAGANSPIAQDKMRLLQRFSQSLFTQALFHDYDFLIRFNKCSSLHQHPKARLPPCLNTSSSTASPV